MINRLKIYVLLVLTACFAGATNGCSKSDAPKLSKVTGTVTLDGQPLDGARLTFNPTDGRPSVGFTDQSGKYSLRYTETLDGATPGEHHIIITSERSPSGGEGSPLIPGRKELLPAIYHSKSELKELVKDTPTVIDFTLTSKAP